MELERGQGENLEVRKEDDYATQMEDVLGLDDGDSEEDFLYQGEDAKELSASYNDQLRTFIDGLGDDEDGSPNNTNDTRNPSNNTDDVEQFIYSSSPKVCLSYIFS